MIAIKHSEKKQKEGTDHFYIAVQVKPWRHKIVKAWHCDRRIGLQSTTSTVMAISQLSPQPLLIHMQVNTQFPSHVTAAPRCSPVLLCSPCCAHASSLQLPPKSCQFYFRFHRIMELLTLEKSCNIKSHHQPISTMPTSHIPECHIYTFLEKLQGQWLRHCFTISEPHLLKPLNGFAFLFHVLGLSDTQA